MRRCLFAAMILIVGGCFSGECFVGGCFHMGESNINEYRIAGQLKVPAPEEAAEDAYAYRYNYEKMKEKGLADSGGPGKYYLNLQAVYRANLDAYLLEETDIEELDGKLKNSGLGFESRSPGKRNLYERESTMGLELIYLRNHLYIENLNERELALLDHQLKNGDTPVTEVLKEMVKRTCPSVVRVRNLEDGENSRRFFYADSPGKEPKIPNQALVLAITNDVRYDASGRLIPGDLVKERCEYLDKVKREKEREYSEILGVPVYILLNDRSGGDL